MWYMREMWISSKCLAQVWYQKGNGKKSSLYFRAQSDVMEGKVTLRLELDWGGGKGVELLDDNIYQAVHVHTSFCDIELLTGSLENLKK